VREAPQLRPVAQQEPGPDPLQGVDQPRQRDRWRVFHKEVDVIRLPVAFHEAGGDMTESGVLAI